MSRILRLTERWRALPAKNRAAAGVCLAVLAAAAVTLTFLVGDLVADLRQAGRAPARDRAWDKAGPLLGRADRRAEQALDKHLSAVHAFLDERKVGCRPFAERLLGLRGKWELVRGEVGDGGAYAEFLREAFEEHLFPMEELQKAVDAAVRGYLAELEAIDDELLVRLRADVGDDALPRPTAVSSDPGQALRGHYQELSRRVAQDLRTDLAVTAGRELFLWEASNVATDLTLKVGAAVAARLGVSSAILSAGAASTWRTLGVGLAVSIVFDAVVSRLIKAAGYDAEERVAARVEETLAELGRTITDGDPEARATLEKIKELQRNDPDPEVRAAAAQAVGSIEAGTRLYGLRRELSQIGAARASLRKETLRRLIREGE